MSLWICFYLCCCCWWCRKLLFSHLYFLHLLILQWYRLSKGSWTENFFNCKFFTKNTHNERSIKTWPQFVAKKKVNLSSFIILLYFMQQDDVSFISKIFLIKINNFSVSLERILMQKKTGKFPWEIWCGSYF